MAQAIPGFNADGFREGIRTAMRMSLPAQPERWPAFVTVSDEAPTAGEDAHGIPFDLQSPDAQPGETVVNDVLCAVITASGGQEQWDFGPLLPGHARLVLLDEEYRRVEGHRLVRLYLTESGDPVDYNYLRVLMQPTLDTVGVWVLEYRSQDTV